MIVGVMEVELKIGDSCSLKDKRKVVKSLIDRTKNNFNVSIAEVGSNDILNFAILGLSFVSSTSRFVDKTFDKIINFWESNFNIEIVDLRRELL